LDEKAMKAKVCVESPELISKESGDRSPLCVLSYSEVKYHKIPIVWWWMFGSFSIATALLA
jgi:hypothetical protein